MDLRPGERGHRNAGELPKKLTDELLLYAREQFRFDKRREDGSTLREHLVARWKMTGEEPRELAEAPPIPGLAVHVWRYFADMDQFRGSSGFGPNPLSPSDILGWSQLTRTPLQDWEIRAVKRLDVAYLSVTVAGDNEDGLS